MFFNCFFFFCLDNYILNEILERLSVCDINSKAFFIILTILSDKVHFKSVIKTLPKIVDILIQLMNTNNSVSKNDYLIKY